MNLGDAVPQTPWDLARSCHPIYVLLRISPGTSVRPRAWSGPEVGARVASLRCPILRSGPDQCKPKSAKLNRASYELLKTMLAESLVGGV